jgi:hypothetical protein
LVRELLKIWLNVVYYTLKTKTILDNILLIKENKKNDSKEFLDFRKTLSRYDLMCFYSNMEKNPPSSHELSFSNLYVILEMIQGIEIKCSIADSLFSKFTYGL